MREILVSGVESGAIPFALFVLYFTVSWSNAFRVQKQVRALLKQVREISPAVYEVALKNRYPGLSILFNLQKSEKPQNYESVAGWDIRFRKPFMQFLEGRELDDVSSIAQQKKVVAHLLKIQLRIAWLPVLLCFIGLLSFAAYSVFPYIRGLMYVLEK